MNTLVYSYGDAAKASGNTIINQVLYGTGTVADKAIAEALTVNGLACNDNNAATTGETWLNGICQGGTNINGATCDDNNALTFADKYTNGVCAGVTNGTACNDGNSLTFGETWLNGVCQGGALPNNTCLGGYTVGFSDAIDCRSRLLSSVDNFSGLTVANHVWLSFNTLTNVNGLSNMISVGSLELQNNNLTNLNGLLNLTTCSSQIQVFNNPELNDISGLKNITSITMYVMFDNKDYIVKLPANSYLCQNYSTRTAINGLGYSTSITKSLICNP